VRPELIIEITSPETRSNDLVYKVEIYAEAGVTHYIIVDTRKWKGQERLYLLSYYLTPDGYESGAVDERGWLWLEPVGVWLGIQDNHVQCYDEAGRPIGDYTTIDTARAEAEARVRGEAEARAKAEARAIAAEARLRELEAEIRRLRGEGET
jgi:hypothetical protein